jgi:prephenate dehydrogenase
MTVQIAIIGLGQIGTSIGLGLQNHKDLVKRVGNDREPAVARQAEKAGAIDQVVFNIPGAVRQADLIILAVPADELRSAMETIAQDLKEGAVVIETTPTKVKAEQWAAELFPAGRYCIGWAPAVQINYLHDHAEGVEAARADLLKDSPVMISAPMGTPGEAIRLATDLAGLLGAKPIFSDAYEVDGLFAGHEVLPQLLSAALVNTVMGQPGWKEGRKVAGRNFTLATAPVEHMPEVEQFGHAAVNNRENVVRMIDGLVEQLDELREALTSDNLESLDNYIKTARGRRMGWLVQRKTADWDGVAAEAAQVKAAGDFFGRLIGMGRKPGDRKK